MNEQDSELEAMRESDREGEDANVFTYQTKKVRFESLTYETKRMK